MIHKQFPLNNYFIISKSTLKVYFVFLTLIFLGNINCSAQEYDEFPVELRVSKLGVTEMPVAIKNQEAYIAVADFLDFLDLKNVVGNNPAEITGFIINPEDSFEFDIPKQKIIYKGENYIIKPTDYILTATTFYLRSSFFGEIFGLYAKFNYRDLSINLETDIELPKVKELRLLNIRQNLNELRGFVTPDTLIERKYPFFRAGMADWSVVTTQQTNGTNDNRFNLGLGTIIAGGETNVLLNYSTRVPFTAKNQFYQWKYVNNNSKLFKQVTAGKIFSRATSSLFAPVVGIQLTNTPVINRRSFGSYTLTDVTDPRWTVELYVNNVLINFTEADASGFFSFEVPLMYGNTIVNLRFYGPYGEERTEERIINIPYNFIPKKELEYTFSAGIVENEGNDRFSRFNLNYGISNGFTLGGGVEYLSDVTSGEFMPFLNTSLKISSNLLFSGEYMHGVKSEGLLSYRTPSSFQIDFNYINYDEDQTAINYNYLEERKISLSLPIRTKFFTTYSRFSINQIILPTTRFTSAQFLMSGSFFGISTNLTTYGLFNERSKTPTIYSTLSQTYRLPYQLLLSPQIQYDFSDNAITNMIVRLERPFLKRGFVNVGFENNFLRNTQIFEIGLRYNLNFTQTSFTSRIGNSNSTFIESARGSFLFDDATGYITSNDRSSVGKGAVTIIPFLDYNDNNVREKSEPSVPGLKIKNLGGSVTYNKDNTQLRIYDLQPYTNFIIQVDTLSLDNIAWKINNPIIALETVPNQFKTIYIPVKVLGEVSGMVYVKDENGTKGQGRISIHILNMNNEIVGKFLTEGDGYFTYLGLKTGKYKAVIDPEQLENIGYKVSPLEIEFSIKETEFGDIVDDLEFILEKNSH
ncbi:hypothetical protein BC962_1261 [Gillisia mitskevichiae]|uniref:Outer membrane usher protein FimD/PapC n=1 Tax=Gillisia mitskevichiae TaxID=270921 RepID=A0A495PSP7_9FLAO|nr:hypothetical protein [Gillisia mitskevichiae]RKS53016.1 hypothetical protein BC962_1261 [Gillisia mitskevichiae]